MSSPGANHFSGSNGCEFHARCYQLRGRAAVAPLTSADHLKPRSTSMRPIAILLVWALFSASVSGAQSYRDTLETIELRLNDLAKRRYYAREVGKVVPAAEQTEADELRSRFYRLNPLQELIHQITADISAIASEDGLKIKQRQKTLDFYHAFLMTVMNDLPEPHSQEDAETMNMKMRCALVARDLEWAKRIAKSTQEEQSRTSRTRP